MFKLFYEQWVKEYDPEHNQCFYRNTCVVVEGRAESASRNQCCVMQAIGRDQVVQATAHQGLRRLADGRSMVHPCRRCRCGNLQASTAMAWTAPHRYWRSQATVSSTIP